MDNIKDILQNVIGDISKKKPSIQQKVENVWKSVLKEQELKHTQLIGVRDRKIFVYVDSPAWLYRIKTKKNKILQQIKSKALSIEDISFEIGQINE